MAICRERTNRQTHTNTHGVCQQRQRAALQTGRAAAVGPDQPCQMKRIKQCDCGCTHLGRAMLFGANTHSINLLQSASVFSLRCLPGCLLLLLINNNHTQQPKHKNNKTQPKVLADRGDLSLIFHIWPIDRCVLCLISCLIHMQTHCEAQLSPLATQTDNSDAHTNKRDAHFCKTQTHTRLAL